MKTAIKQPKINKELTDTKAKESAKLLAKAQIKTAFDQISKGLFLF